MGRLIPIIHKRFGTDYVRVANKSELIFHCPFCNEMGNRNDDRKLYVNDNTGNYHCYRCGTSGNLIREFNKYGIDYNHEFGIKISNVVSSLLNNHESIDDIDYKFMIPGSLVVNNFNSVAYEYCKSRGLTNDELYNYSVRSFSTDKEFINRIIFPNRLYGNRFTDIYAARSMFDSVKPRYKYPSGVSKSGYVFNIHNIEDNPPFIIINEGVINSIIAGNYSVAIYGKSISNEQFNLIKNKNPKIIYISFDRDADSQANELAVRFIRNTKIQDVRRVDLEIGVDASDMGHDRYMDLVLRSDRFCDNFKDFSYRINKFLYLD